jgi:hypothetical protein
VLASGPLLLALPLGMRRSRWMRRGSLRLLSPGGRSSIISPSRRSHDDCYGLLFALPSISSFTDRGGLSRKLFELTRTMMMLRTSDV